VRNILLTSLVGLMTTISVPALASCGFVACVIGGPVGNALDNLNRQAGHPVERGAGAALNYVAPGSGTVYTIVLNLQHPGFFRPQADFPVPPPPPPPNDDDDDDGF
jgi:hypothetical protein